MTITRRWQTGCELNWWDEFDGYLGAGIIISSASKKTGTYSYQMGGNSSVEGSFYKNVPVTYQVRFGLHLRTPNTKYNNTQVRTIRVMTDGGGAELFRMLSNPSGTGMLFYVQNGAQQVGGLVPITQDLYYHWGIDLKINASTGWCYIYKDGDLVASFSGDTGSAQIGRIDYGSYPALGAYIWDTSQYAYYDDMFIDDTTGEGAAARVPDRRFPLISPDGNGNYSQMTGSDGNQVDNYLLVDEIPPSSADYVRAGSADLIDSYTLEDYTLPVNASIIAVIPTAAVRKESVEDMKLALGTRLSSTDLVGSDQALGTSYETRFERQTTKPGGGAWTETDVDNAEVIIKSRGTYT